MRLSGPVLIAAAAATFGGCASTDRVVFVTSTEIGIGADATTGSVNIGYDRVEGVYGPAYPETGGIPPVYAHNESDLQIFQPKVRQLYATGEAAKLATRQKTDGKDGDVALTGKRRAMFFGTTTNVGLMLQFAGGQPTSINFGFKRKEFSVLPLRTEDPSDDKPDKYGSLIASYSSQVDSASLRESGLQISQFIATGAAAVNLAKMDSIQTQFENGAKAALQAAAASDRRVFITEIDLVLACVERNDGSFDAGARDQLVGAATGIDGMQAAALKGAKNSQDLRRLLTGVAIAATQPLAKAAAANSAKICV